MEFYEVVKRRRTVREFKADPVPEEAVRRALAAGLQAPCNAHLKEELAVHFAARPGEEVPGCESGIKGEGYQ